MECRTCACYKLSFHANMIRVMLCVIVIISHLIGKIMTGFDAVIYYHFQPKISQWIDQVF